MDSTDYIRFSCRINGGPEQSIAEKYDNFNEDSWLTVSKGGLRGETLQLIIATKSDAGERHFFDDIKITTPVGPEWPVVPSALNILVATDRVIEYTNSAPAKTGFYRLRATVK